MSDGALRDARRARVFDAMRNAGLDVLVLGRRDDVAYASGARALWTAGTRPFGAACVVVRKSRAVHLLSTWDEGVPPEIPFEHLYGLSWNPSVMAGSLRAIDGLAEASSVGIDAWSPGFARAIARIAPSAGVVPADDLLHSVRAVKLDAEVDRIRAAVSVAAAGVAAAIDARAAGAGEPAALGAALEEMARLGCTIPSSEPIVHGGVVDIGVLHDGYEGGVGRTAGAQSGAADDAHGAVVAACRAGASGDDLLDAARGADVRVRGSGMGFEPPVIRAGLGGEVRLRAGMVLSVLVAVDGAYRRDLVLVGEAQGTAF